MKKSEFNKWLNSMYNSASRCKAGAEYSNRLVLQSGEDTGALAVWNSETYHAGIIRMCKEIADELDLKLELTDTTLAAIEDYKNKK